MNTPITKQTSRHQTQALGCSVVAAPYRQEGETVHAGYTLCTHETQYPAFPVCVFWQLRARKPRKNGLGGFKQLKSVLRPFLGVLAVEHSAATTAHHIQFLVFVSAHPPRRCKLIQAVFPARLCTCQALVSCQRPFRDVSAPAQLVLATTSDAADSKGPPSSGTDGL